MAAPFIVSLTERKKQNNKEEPGVVIPTPIPTRRSIQRNVNIYMLHIFRPAHKTKKGMIQCASASVARSIDYVFEAEKDRRSNIMCGKKNLVKYERKRGKGRKRRQKI